MTGDATGGPTSPCFVSTAPADLVDAVLDEEAKRPAAQDAARLDTILPDDLLPGVGGEEMTLREGLRQGGWPIACRAFRNADLFGDLTACETLMTALEARERTALTATLLRLPKAGRAERAKRAEADELIAFFGLGRYADTFVSELSTGTRRIVELGCLRPFQPTSGPEPVTLSSAAEPSAS
jgi:hypothetical protein